MRMAAIAFDLRQILVDRIFAMVAAILGIRFRSTHAHIVLTLFACHICLRNYRVGALISMSMSFFCEPPMKPPL